MYAPCSRTPGRLNCHVAASVAFTRIYRLGPPTSQLSLGAPSLKGDSPLPTAHTFPVYASPASLPNRRNTRFLAWLTTTYQGRTPLRFSACSHSNRWVVRATVTCRNTPASPGAHILMVPDIGTTSKYYGAYYNVVQEGLIYEYYQLVGACICTY